MSLLKPSQEKEEKIPGKFARGYMRLQAFGSLIGAGFTPIWTTYSAIRGKISIPFGTTNFDIDINSPIKRSATVIGGLLYSAYMGLNGFARLRTAKDTATREKISLGELEPENAVFKSNGKDRTLTKIEASISSAISVGSLGYAIHTATSKEKNPLTSFNITFATVNAVIAGVMSVVKFRAANAAEKSAQEREAVQPQSATALPERSDKEQMQPPAPFSERERTEQKQPAMAGR